MTAAADSARTKYRAKTAGPYPFTAEMLDLIHRRTIPFLDGIGITTRPLSEILKDAYLQGMNDAVDALNHRDAASPLPTPDPEKQTR